MDKKILMHLDMATLKPKVRQKNKTKWEIMFAEIQSRLKKNETLEQIAQDTGYSIANIGRILHENGTSVAEVRQKRNGRG